jgi:hypothetical protein
VRYRVLDLPAKGVGAFCPTPAAQPVASSYGLVELYGSPGTDPSPAPKPQNDYLPSLTRRGGVDSAQGSMVAPDVIYPDDYTPFADNMGPAKDAGIGMWRRRHTELPVPARNPVRLPLPALRPAVFRGRQQIPWPRAFQRWPSRGSGD